MRKKKLLSLLLVGTMVAGLITGCGSSSKDTSKSDSGKSKGGKVVLNVINYHVGTDYAADYYKYLFDAFKKTDEGSAFRIFRMTHTITIAKITPPVIRIFITRVLFSLFLLFFRLCSAASLFPPQMFNYTFHSTIRFLFSQAPYFL